MMVGLQSTLSFEIAFEKINNLASVRLHSVLDFYNFFQISISFSFFRFFSTGFHLRKRTSILQLAVKPLEEFLCQELNSGYIWVLVRTSSSHMNFEISFKMKS